MLPDSMTPAVVLDTLSNIESGYNATIVSSVYRENYADGKSVGLSIKDDISGGVSI